MSRILAADGYEVLNPPVFVDEWKKGFDHFGKVENLEENRVYQSVKEWDKHIPGNDFCKKSLPELTEGEELYYWYDIRILSGSAGFLVVKDGMVLRKNRLIMA